MDRGRVSIAAARCAPGGGRNRTESAAAVGSLATDRGPEPLTGCFAALAATGPRAALLHDIDFLSRYRLSLLLASSVCRTRPNMEVRQMYASGRGPVPRRGHAAALRSQPKKETTHVEDNRIEPETTR